MKKILPITLFLSILNGLHAEGEQSVLRDSGKIYVVVGIILIIFLLIVLYLVRIDRKIGKIENQGK